jgi:hypothetical protein
MPKTHTKALSPFNEQLAENPAGLLFPPLCRVMLRKGVFSAVSGGIPPRKPDVSADGKPIHRAARSLQRKILARLLAAKGTTMSMSIAREPSPAPGLIPNDLPLAPREWRFEVRHQL